MTMRPTFIRVTQLFPLTENHGGHSLWLNMDMVISLRRSVKGDRTYITTFGGTYSIKETPHELFECLAEIGEAEATWKEKP